MTRISSRMIFALGAAMLVLAQIHLAFAFLSEVVPGDDIQVSADGSLRIPSKHGMKFTNWDEPISADQFMTFVRDSKDDIHELVFMSGDQLYSIDQSRTFKGFDAVLIVLKTGELKYACSQCTHLLSFEGLRDLKDWSFDPPKSDWAGPSFTRGKIRRTLDYPFGQTCPEGYRELQDKEGQASICHKPENKFGNEWLAITDPANGWDENTWCFTKENMGMSPPLLSAISVGRMTILEPESRRHQAALKDSLKKESYCCLEPIDDVVQLHNLTCLDIGSESFEKRPYEGVLIRWDRYKDLIPFNLF